MIPRPGSDPSKLAGLAKINLSTGDMVRFDQGPAPSTASVVSTAGGLVFHGDMSRRFDAFDAQTGKKLWESILGGNVSVSTITYAVDGKEYICVMTGYNLKVPELNNEIARHARADRRQRDLRFRAAVDVGRIAAAGFSNL